MELDVLNASSGLERCVREDQKLILDREEEKAIVLGERVIQEKKLAMQLCGLY